MRILSFVAAAAVTLSAAPAFSASSASEPAPALPSQGAVLVLRNKMPVVSSDGVRVAEINHVTGSEQAFGPDKMFFTADRYYNLRRIYGREATVKGGIVHLKMTAAQFTARNQNPD